MIFLFCNTTGCSLRKGGKYCPIRWSLFHDPFVGLDISRHISFTGNWISGLSKLKYMHLAANALYCSDFIELRSTLSSSQSFKSMVSSSPSLLGWEVAPWPILPQVSFNLIAILGNAHNPLEHLRLALLPIRPANLLGLNLVLLQKLSFQYNDSGGPTQKESYRGTKVIRTFDEQELRMYYECL